MNSFLLNPSIRFCLRVLLLYSLAIIETITIAKKNFKILNRYSREDSIKTLPGCSIKLESVLRDPGPNLLGFHALSELGPPIKKFFS